MTEIPSWWLVLSGVFFAAGIVVLVLLAVLGAKAAAAIAALQPKAVETLQKVDKLAASVDELAASVKSTVDDVGEKARHMAGGAEHLTLSTARVLGRYPWLETGLAVALRLAGLLRSYQGAQAKRPAAKRPNAKRAPEDAPALAAEVELSINR